MKRVSILALVSVGALAACSQQPNNTSPSPTPTVASTDQMDNMTLDQKVAATLDKCKQVQASCGTGDVAGYFVFPDVTNIALGVGGAGGEGALVENGKITGHYKMGEGSVGLQAGVTAASYVFKIKDKTALDKYKKDGQWSIGAGAGVTVAKADANGQGQADNAKSVLYVFNSEGLMGDAKVDAMKIWRSDDADMKSSDTMTTDSSTGSHS